MKKLAQLLIQEGQIKHHLQDMQNFHRNKGISKQRMKFRGLMKTFH